MNSSELIEFLNSKVLQYNNPKFISSDPIQIPHSFTRKEDIEIIGFLVATIAWGNRKSIIKNGKRLVAIMGNAPYDFVINYSEKDKENLTGFVHRTFNSIDLNYFILSLQHIYTHHNGLEAVFYKGIENKSIQPSIHKFKHLF